MTRRGQGGVGLTQGWMGCLLAPLCPGITMNRQQQQPHADKSKATQGSAPSASEPRDMLESRGRSDWKLESAADCPLTASRQAAPEGLDSLLQHTCEASSLRLRIALASKSPRLSGQCQARGLRRRADCSKRSWCPSSHTLGPSS